MRLICKEIKDISEIKVGDFYIIKPDLFSNPFICDLYFGKLINMDYQFKGFKWERAFSDFSSIKSIYTFYTKNMQRHIDTQRTKIYKILNFEYVEYLYKNNKFLKIRYNNLISLIAQK